MNKDFKPIKCTKCKSDRPATMFTAGDKVCILCKRAFKKRSDDKTL